jgi:hypothetical protein
MANFIELGSNYIRATGTPRSRVGARAAHTCSGLIAVEAAGRWLLLLGDPKI